MFTSTISSNGTNYIGLKEENKEHLTKNETNYNK